jgi:hypothetical protein
MKEDGSLSKITAEKKDKIQWSLLQPNYLQQPDTTTFDIILSLAISTAS